MRVSLVKAEIIPIRLKLEKNSFSFLEITDWIIFWDSHAVLAERTEREGIFPVFSSAHPAFASPSPDGFAFQAACSRPNRDPHRSIFRVRLLLFFSRTLWL